RAAFAGEVPVTRVTVRSERDHLPLRCHARRVPRSFVPPRRPGSRFVRGQRRLCSPFGVSNTIVGMTALETRPSEAFANDRAHVFHSWSAQGALTPLVISRAAGSEIWDESGTRFLDFSSQLVNVNIGHQH